MLRGSKPGKRGRRSYFAAGSRSTSASTDSLKLRVGGRGLGGRGRRRTSAVVVGGCGLLGRGRRCTKVVLCFGSGASTPLAACFRAVFRRRVVRAMVGPGQRRLGLDIGSHLACLPCGWRGCLGLVGGSRSAACLPLPASAGVAPGSLPLSVCSAASCRQQVVPPPSGHGVGEVRSLLALDATSLENLS